MAALGREAPGGHAARPLTREPSAGAGWRPYLYEPQGSRRGRSRGRHPDSAVAVRGWGASPGPAQAGPTAPVILRPGVGRSRGCARGLFWLQKSTRGVWSKRSSRLGLAIRPRARRVKGRSKPAHGGKTAGTVAGSRRSRALGPHGSRDGGESLGRGGRERGASRELGGAGAGEGALVEGRRPGSAKRSSLTRRPWRRAWRLRLGGFDRKVGTCPGGAATEDVRGHVTGSACGRKLRGRVAQRGGAPRSRLRQDRAASGSSALGVTAPDVSTGWLW